MFRKKPTQSQSISASNVVGSQNQMTQAGEDATATQQRALLIYSSGTAGAFCEVRGSC